MKTLHAAAVMASLALAACNSQPAEEAAPEQDAAAQSAPIPPTPSPIADEIPTSMQGKWGMTPADCEIGRSDAKGLMTVGPTTLEFYESRGELRNIESRGENSLHAEFAFTGEGMEWTRDMTLETLAGDTELVRTETGDDASSEPFRYSKCG